MFVNLTLKSASVCVCVCVCVCVFRALKALWQYLGSKGVNTTLIWEKIKDIVIKTVIA